MNEPIISPIWFYIIDLCDSLVMGLFILAAFLFVCLMIGIDELERKNFLKSYLIFFAMVILLIIFIPSGKTVRNMLIASQITPAQVEAVGKLTETSIDKVIDKIIKASEKRGKDGKQ